MGMSLLSVDPANWHTAMTIAGISVAVTLFSCQGIAEPESITPGRLHPTQENIPVVEDARFVLREGDSDQLYLEFTESPLHTVGVNEGAKRAMIGSIGDVAVRRSALYYADGEYGEIRVYDHAGTTLAVVGSHGQGPGEFQDLTRIAVTGDETRLFAWDMLSRIQVFGKRDSIYVLENTFHIVANAYEGDICVVNDHLYAIGYSAELDGIIHKYTFAGDHVTSFGARYKSSFSLLSMVMSRLGRLKCDERLGIIAHVNYHLPILTGYSQDGSLVWRVKFADFRPAVVEELLDDGSPGVNSWQVQPGESAGFTLIQDQVSDSLIVRYPVRGDGAATPGVAHYFSVDWQTGEGVYLGRRSIVEGNPKPRLIGADSSRVYAAMYSPFPQLQIYRRSGVQL